MKSKEAMPEVSTGQIDIIGELRSRNLILRNAIRAAITKGVSSSVMAALQTALDREIGLSR